MQVGCLEFDPHIWLINLLIMVGLGKSDKVIDDLNSISSAFTRRNCVCLKRSILNDFSRFNYYPKKMVMSLNAAHL